MLIKSAAVIYFSPTNTTKRYIRNFKRYGSPLMAKVLPENSARMFTEIPIADMSLCNHCGGY